MLMIKSLTNRFLQALLDVSISGHKNLISETS